MRPREVSIACLLLAMSSCATGAVAPAGEPERRVDRVDIVSDWDGLGRPGHGERTVDGRSRADAARLAALLRALEAAPLRAVDLENLGLTKAWLVDNVAAALKERIYRGNIASALKEADGRWSHARLTTEERERFATAFTDLDLVGPLVKGQIGIGIVHTDDYPTLAATLTLRGGETIRVSSKRQQGLLMLPWTVERAGSVFVTYNADINRALVALMPRRFTNRGRISEQRLRFVIASSVIEEKAKDWSAQKARELFRPALGSRYEILEAHFGSQSVFDLVGDDQNLWVAKLADHTLPAWLRIGAAIPFKGERLVGLDVFRKGLDRAVGLVFSQPWLTDYLAAHPQVRVTVHWSRGRSLSPEAAAQFVEDLGAGGHAELATRLAPLLDRAAFLDVDEGCCSAVSRWLVLPDGRMVLWLWDGGEKSLGRATAGLLAWACYGWKCSGAVYGREGTPTSDPQMLR